MIKRIWFLKRERETKYSGEGIKKELLEITTVKVEVKNSKDELEDKIVAMYPPQNIDQKSRDVK